MLKIDILVKSYENCEKLESKINLAARLLNLEVTVNKTSNFTAFSALAINPSQTPVVIINGHVEFAGRTPELDVISRRLAEIQRGY